MSMPRTASGLCFASAISTDADTAAAAAEVARHARDRLGVPPTLALAFVSHHHGPEFAGLAEALCAGIGSDRLIGCTGEAIVGGTREIEGKPALALWLAHLPGAEVYTMALDFVETPEGGSLIGWPDDLSDTWPAGSALIALGDPFSFPADAFLARMNEDHPGVPVVGGMASGGWTPGQNRLLLGRRALERGAVAARVSGPIAVRAVVSQGCRPIGQHFVVTRSDRNLIQELGGKPALEQLQEVYEKLPARDQELAQRALHVGRVIDEYRGAFGRGDFLVRNVLGADPGSGAIAIGDLVRPGQTVQFHVRDAESADEDLRELVAGARRAAASPPLGALLFTCNGRGTRLFGQPDHDVGVLREHLADVPVAGFFAQGELGPIGGKNFIHGFTASIVLFEQREHG